MIYSLTLFEFIGYVMVLTVKKSKFVSRGKMLFEIFSLFLFFFHNCFAAKNNCHTRHLAKILFHLACCLQESMSSSGASPLVYEKAFNAVYISSIFLKHLIESDQGENIQLYPSLEDNEDVQKDVLRGMYDSRCFRFRIKSCKCTHV